MKVVEIEKLAEFRNVMLYNVRN